MKGSETVECSVYVYNQDSPPPVARSYIPVFRKDSARKKKELLVFCPDYSSIYPVLPCLTLRYIALHSNLM